MNKKGFTLIELILVIALLAIIATISVSVIGNITQKNKKNQCENLQNNILSAAKMYVTDNRYNMSFIKEENEKYIASPSNSNEKLQLLDLIENNYITYEERNENGTIYKEIINPINGMALNNSMLIIVKYNSNSKDFTYALDARTGYELNCQ